MELLCDTPLSMDKVFEILVKVREEGHVDKLNYFNEGHSLDVLSREDIETKLHKSFDIDVVSLSRIFGKALEVTELIRFAHYAIETANNVEKEKGKKRKTGQGSSESKKLKKADELEHDSGALHVDQDAIHQRIAELESVTKCTKYAKQKAGLKTELEAFLACLTDKKNLDNASPADVRMFLAHKDLHGKTQIHSMTCAFRGRHGSFSCGCPFRRSYGSLDSLVGQLRAIFRDHGRDREWNDIFGCGNPVASCIIRGYLSSARLEQSSAGVSPKQSAPLFADKLTMISRHISYRLSNPNLVKQEKFILHRDRAFLQILGQTGDRAGDLANLLSDQIFWLPEKEGLFFCLHKGKTVSLEDPRTVIIMQSQALDFCPVNSLLSYIALCKDLDLDLKTGYLFRAWDTSCNTISDKPFSSAAVNARLKSYLQRLHIWDGETPHGTRSGVALTLSWLGFGVDAIKNHVGWKTDKMYRHYTKDHDWK